MTSRPHTLLDLPPAAAPPAPPAAPCATMTDDAFELTTHDRLDSVSPADWASLFPGHPDSLEMCRLVATEGLPGFTFASLVVRHEGLPILLLPLFHTSFDVADLVEGRVAAVIRGLSTILPRALRPRLLGVGFVEGEWGAIGVREGTPGHVIRTAWNRAVPALEQYRRRHRCDVTVFLNFPPARVSRLPAEPAGFSSIDGYPCARVPLNFATPDAYLASLSKSARRDLRRKLRGAEQLTVVRTTDVAAHADRVHALYLRTVQNAELSLGAHTRDYFARVCAEVPGAHYVLYFLGGQLLAFNLLVATSDTLVDKYFAMDPDAGRERNLYFVSWFENVRHCIAHGIRTYHAGPGAEATKARLGATFLSSKILFRHRNPLIHRALHALRPLLAYTPAVSADAAPDQAIASDPLTPVCINVDNAVIPAQPEIARHVAHTLDLTADTSRYRLCTSSKHAADLRSRLLQLRSEVPGPWLTFIGSGDFHYLSLLLLQTLPPSTPPFTLVLIDNHPDWFAEWPAHHCGNWVSSALKLPSLRRAILLGQDSADFPWYRSIRAPYEALRTGRLQIHPLRIKQLVFPGRWRSSIPAGTPTTRRPSGTRFALTPMQSVGVQNSFSRLADSLAGQPIYISVDKDCLRPDDAVTDWEQGGLSLADLTAGLRALASRCHLIGADTCGDHAPAPLTGFLKRLDAGRLGKVPPPPADWRERNQAANLAILEALGVKGPVR